MRFRLTLVLLVLNLVAFGAILWLDVRGPNEAAYDAVERLVVPPGATGEVQRVALSGPVLPTPWTIERLANRWELRAPVRWPANPFAVDRLLNQLGTLQWEARLTPADLARSNQTPASFGLEIPLARIELEGGESRFTFSIGAPEEAQRLYVRNETSGIIYATDRGLLEALALELDALRDDRIFGIGLFEIRGIGMQMAAPGNLRMRLVRDGDRWSFEAPIQAPADPVEVEAAIDDLIGLRISRFVPADLAAQGLADPGIRVTLEGNRRRETLLLGAEAPAVNGQREYFAKFTDRETVFTVPAAPIDTLQAAQESLRKREFVEFNPARLTGLMIGRGEREVNLQKLETGAWEVRFTTAEGSLTTWPADGAVMEDVIIALINLRAERFISDAPSAEDLARYGFDDPQREVRITTRGETDELLLGDLDGDSGLVYAKLAGAPFVYQVEPPILFRVRVQPLYYRERTLRELPQGAQIVGLELERLRTGAVEIDLEREPDQPWSEVIRDRSAREAAALGVLFEQLRSFTVRDYLANRYTPEAFPLDDEASLPWALELRVTLSLAGGEQSPRRTYAYRFTERVGGTAQYGGDPLEELMFTLPQSLIDTLEALAPTPAPLPVAPPEAP